MLSDTTSKADFIEKPAMGKQVLSTKDTRPSFSFGRQHREDYHKAYINKEMAVRGCS